MAHEFTTSYLRDSISLFHFYKRLGEESLAQVSDEQLFVVLDPEMNSLAIIVNHLAGNMRSRWTDFLTSDGEKPNRNRDREFDSPPQDRAAVMELWEDGWGRVLGTLASLADNDMDRSVSIRGEAHSVMQAILRQVTHYAYHVGQMVFLAKHLQHERWKSLSVPRGKSAEFTRKVIAGEMSQR